MVRLEPTFDPAVLEEEVRGLWKAHGLPSKGGTLGPAGGPLTLQFEGTFTPSEPESLVAHRAIAADVDARYLALVGRRAFGTLRYESPGAPPGVPRMQETLARLGIWTGGDGTVPWDATPRHERVEAMVGRLAHRGVLVSRDLPMRSCPVCGEPRSPEQIIYQEEDGATYLVRFNFSLDDRVVSALVWVDAPWRLLGTSALLVRPDLAYVVARCRQGAGEELVLTSRSSLERFRTWSPRVSFEIVEEHPGRYFEGRAYDYPLRHEFPTGGTLPAPNGTILATPDVTDTGTGIVPLVPGHGSTDAEIAGARGVAGWPLVTPRGQLDLTLMHKYSGLDLVTGSEFILRDLDENGAIFASLKVRRGVPHCATCGSTLLWIPGRAWCLEPSRFPARQAADYARLLPDAPPLDRIEVAPWPVSATGRHDVPEAIALLECSRCERLDALSGPVECPCGARRFPVRRRLTGSAAGALSAWARFESFPVAAPIRLYLGDRRRVPAVVHQLMALAAVEGEPGEVGLSILPTVSDVVLGDLVAAWGADAVRATFVRGTTPERASGAFPDHCRTERNRLGRLWSGVEEVLAGCDPAMLSGFGQPIAGFLGELEPEDRALLARWERDRVFALTDYDHNDPASAYRRVFRFLESDLAQYRVWVRARLAHPGSPTTKRAAFRTLVHVFRESMSVLAPVCPHTADAIHRRLSMGGSSLFEGSLAPADRSLLNDELCTAWDRWAPILRGIAEFRRKCSVGRDVSIPSMALVVTDDGLGDQLRSDRTVLERLARVDRIDIGSPRSPWTGRHGQYRPVESEIQRVYPSQAAQIAHLLGRTPPRVRAEGGSTGELSVVVQGQPVRIFPSMVEYVETLPAGFVPHPWSRGEMYLELPSGANKPDRVPPPLSPDAVWLVRRLDRRLRAARGFPTAPEGIAVIAGSEPLTGEFRRYSDAIARYLGLLELRIVDFTAEQPPGRMMGRSRTGSPWWVDLPGLNSPPRRVKHRTARPRCRRVPVGPPGKPTPEVDFGADDFIERSKAVRKLGSELDDVLGVPLLGPTKVAHAWDAGLQSIEAYRGAPFEQLESLPGFGAAIAYLLVQKLGGSLPPPGVHPLRSRTARSGAPERHVPASPEAGSTSSAIAVVEPRVPVTLEEAPSNAVVPPLSHSESGPPVEEPIAVSEGGPPSSGSAPPEAPTGSTASVPPPEPIPLGPPEATPIPAVETPASGETVPSAESEPPSGATVSGEGGGEVPESATQPSVPSETSEAISEPSGSGPSPVLGEAEPAPAQEEGGSGPESTDQSLEVPPGQEEGVSASPEALTEVLLEPDASVQQGDGTGSPASAPEAEVPPPEPLEEIPPKSTEATEVPEETSEPLEEEAESETAEPPEGPDVSEAPEQVPLESPPSSPEAEAAPGSPPSEPPSLASIETPTVPVEPPAPPELNSPVAPVPGGPIPRDAVATQPIQEIPIPPSSEVPVAPSAPPVATRAPAPSGIELEIGSSPFTSIQPFLDATAAGHRGVCLVRESPERVTAQVGPRPVDVYWLTNLGRGKTLRPSDLPGIFALLQRAVDQDHVTALFLEGIEYLVRLHGVEELIDRLSDLDRRARSHDARVWVHLTPDLLRAPDLKRITASLGSRSSA